MSPHATGRGTPAAVETIDAEPIGPDALLEAAAPPAGDRSSFPAFPAVVLGTIAGWDEAARPLVVYPGCPAEHPLPALTTVQLPDNAFGREAALQFVGGDPSLPVIVGLVQPPTCSRPGMNSKKQSPATGARVDGERVEFTAAQEVVLRCGQASITLTRAGKVIIEGAYVVTRSSGVNRIKGGSVQIN